MKDKPAPERMIKRAAELWMRAVKAPVYDNGDGGLGMMLMGVRSVEAAAQQATDAVERFGAELRHQLSTQQESNGYTYYARDLRVDYNPDDVLADAARAAGLLVPLPVKTVMWLHDDYVDFRQGYGAESFKHYPLADGRWLVTTLSGGQEQTTALIAFAEEHGPTGFYTIEEN